MAAARGLSPDEYAKWINARIGAELRQRREARGLSAYALGRAGGTCDQTILNMEQGTTKNGSLIATLARICVRFETTLSEFVAAAERRRG